MGKKRLKQGPSDAQIEDLQFREIVGDDILRHVSYSFNRPKLLHKKLKQAIESYPEIETPINPLQIFLSVNNIPFNEIVRAEFYKIVRLFCYTCDSKLLSPLYGSLSKPN